MRRILTLTLLGVLGTVGLKAQTVVNTFPYTQNFDNFTTCSTSSGAACTLSEGWENDTNDDIDWTVDAAGTTSSFTGPDGDHTTGNGNYLYTESSTNNVGYPNKVAHLLSPYFDFTNAATPQMSFWYHMLGGDMGTMHVDVQVGTAPFTLDVIPSFTDDSAAWQQQIVDLTAFGNTDSVRIRIRGITGPNFESDMAIDDVVVENLVNNNIGVASLDAPVAPFAPGMQPVDVTIENFGSNTVTSATINWEADGVAQTPFSYTGTLASATTDGPINLGMFNFPAGNTTLKIWTSMPNGVMDADPANDTLEVTVCTPVTGVFTIGATGDFLTFNDAVNQMINCGIGGPITFNVQPGTYNESVIIPEIPGMGPLNPIVFQGADAATTTITYDATGSLPTVGLQGADFVTFKKLTVENTGTSEAWGFKLWSGASNNTIDSCTITVTSGLTFDACAVSASESLTSEFTEGQTAFFTTVSNNMITGGENPIHFEGDFNDRIPGNQIVGNHISGFNGSGIYMDNLDSTVISGNTIIATGANDGDGIYMFDLVDFAITDNFIVAEDYGLYVADGNFDDPPTAGRSVIINNMVSSTSDYGIYLDDNEFVDVFHNSTLGEPGIRINDFVDLDIRNNIFGSTGDFAFEADEDASFLALDFNIYYAAAGNTNFVDFGFNTYADLASWITDYPTLNASSIAGNPVFASATDLHVTGTLANDVGDNTVGVTTDIDGDTRPLAPSTTVDIGADEYTPLAYDLKLVSIDSLSSDCGLGSVPVSITVSNLGTQDVTGAVAGYSVNGGTLVTETIPGTITSGTTVAFTFTTPVDLSVPGDYTISGFATATTPPDEDNSNDTASVTVTSVPTISSFPYFEDFENGTGGWRSGGANNSWAFGTPAKDVITGAASGTNAWVTGGLGTGTYNPDEQSFVVGPCFDMTSAPAEPWVALKIWWEAEFSWDGAVLQTTTDSGATWTNVGAFGDPNNWYTDNTINASPGGSSEGWSGRQNSGNGSNGYVQATHPLDPTLVGEPNVQFRIAFAGDGSVHDDGVAIDDFGIGALPNVNLGPDTATLCIGDMLDAGDFGGTYAWSTGDSTQTIMLMNSTGSDIVDSMITVTVVDSLGLTNTDTIVVNIKATLPTVAATVVSDVLCNGDTTGEALAAGTGIGTLSYTWNTNPIQFSANATNLIAGDYTVTVVDSFGCEATDTVSISEPTALTVALDSITDANCAGESSGAIAITPGGGTAPYSYLWDNGDTTQNLSMVPAGDYVGTIIDANGCELVSPTLTVGQPDSLDVRLDSLADASCPDAMDGSISITTFGGTTPYSYSWSNGDTTEDLSAVMPGDYVGTITDANGCVLVSPTLSVAATDSATTAEFTFAFQNGETIDFTNLSSGNATSFAWDFGDGAGTSTDENPSYTYLQNDTLTVTLIATGPCGSDTTTQEIQISTVSISDLLDRAISVYPNPSDGQFTLSFESMSADNISVTVFNAQGQRVMESSPAMTRGSFHTDLDIRNEAEGTYLIYIEVDGQLVTKQIVKR